MTEQELEYLRLKLSSEVEDKVEATLRRRYTWLGIIVSTILAAGGLVYVVSLFAGLEQLRIEAELAAKNARAKTTEIGDLADNLGSRLASVNEQMADAESRAKGLLIERQTDLELMRQVAQRVTDLSAEVQRISVALKLPAQETRMEAASPLDDSVQSMAAESGEVGAIERSAQSTLDQISQRGTVVYFQFSGAARWQALEISDQLRATGWNVPGVERKPSSGREVRYFHESDRLAAERLADAASAVLAELNYEDSDVRVVPLLDFPRAPREGFIEVWLDLPLRAEIARY